MDNSSEFMNNTFFLTTAIDYANGRPHFGHAYEKCLADMIARYQRSLGKEVFFLTGTDEHGQKVQQSAQKNNQEPQQYVDEVTAGFVDLCQKLQITQTKFVRTTDPVHKKFVNRLSKPFMIKERSTSKNTKGFIAYAKSSS